MKAFKSSASALISKIVLVTIVQVVNSMPRPLSDASPALECMAAVKTAQTGVDPKVSQLEAAMLIANAIVPQNLLPVTYSNTNT